MRKIVLTALFCVVSASAFAGVKLINKDSKSYDITIKCGSTVQTSIGSSVHRDIGSGPCEVTVKDTGSSDTGGNGDTLVIQGGQVTRQ